MGGKERPPARHWPAWTPPAQTPGTVRPSKPSFDSSPTPWPTTCRPGSLSAAERAAAPTRLPTTHASAATCEFPFPRDRDSANLRASAFDLLRLSGTDTTGWPYRRRRAALESVFAVRRLSAPWALCPSTTEADVVREWLTWASVGMEGVVFKRLDDVYRPSVRGWEKYKVRETSEAIVGAITGSLSVPRTLLLGRHDDEGRIQYVGRTTSLAQAAGAAIAGLLTAGRRGHPWTGWSFSAGWGSQEKLDVTLVEPEMVVEVGVDVARDASGRWRHPARWHRARPDLSPADVPRLTSPPR
ncbi:ATP-dependent DNA ligase [Streptomyces canus]|uniref:ATP-dependent DNA ligase n=1 Tax=Streptomyces canus TaxID=58343 RepID=UPI003867EBB7